MSDKEFNNFLVKIKYDKEAFITIYNYYFPRIVMHIRRKYPKVSAEDIAQDFFLNLLHIENYKYINNPTSWIYTSCDNLVKKTISKIELVDIENLQIKDDKCILNQVIMTEQMRVVFDILGDDTSKSIFYLYYWEGYNLREITDFLKLKKSTIKQKHTRGIKKLRKFL